MLVVLIRQDALPSWSSFAHGTRSTRKKRRLVDAGKFVKLPLVVVGTTGLPARNQFVKSVVASTS